MKKVMILMGAVCLFAVGSCKKGDEDPALSLLTRKARLTGVWEIKSYERSNEYYENDGLLWTSESKLESGVIHTQVENIGWGTSKTNKEVIGKNEFKFYKDGTWERLIIKNSTLIKNDFFYVETELADVYHIKKGTWAFEGKTKGAYKSKERLVLTVLEDSSIMYNRSFVRDYYNENEVDLLGDLDDYIKADKLLPNEKIEVLYISRLSNSELKLQYGEDFSNYTEDQKNQYGNCVLESYFLEKQ